MKKAICLLITMLLAFSIFPLISFTGAQTTPTVTLDPSTTSATQLQQIVTLNITVHDVSNLWAWSGTLVWDPAVLSLVNSTSSSKNPAEGTFLTQVGQTTFISNKPRYGMGQDLNCVLFTQTGASGSGLLATVKFLVIAQSPTTSVQFGNITLESPPTTVGAVGGPEIPLAVNSVTAAVNFASGGAPVADPGLAQTVTAGTTVTFNGTGSLSSGAGLNYNWTFTYNGANQTLSGVNPTFTFSIPGIYTVTLTVTDSNGQNSKTVIVTVNNTSKPKAIINVEGLSNDQSVQTGHPVTFNGTGSYEDNNGTIVRYIWATNGITIGTTAILTYNFSISSTSASASENITLTVFDVTNQNDTAFTQINVVPGTDGTPTPTDSAQSPTNSPTNSASDHPTATPINYYAGESLPIYVTAILGVLTVLVIGGSTVWLRRKS